MSADDPRRAIDPSDLDRRDGYRLMTSIVVPRPIGWLTTISDDGSVNLAPFSFFNAVSANPPVVMASIGQRRGEPKDTARNILARRQFVANIATADLAGAVEATGADLPYETSEVEPAGLTLLPSERVDPPRVAESPIHLEAELLRTVELEGCETLIVFGRVVLYHLREDLLDDGIVDPLRLRPLARMGAGRYGSIGEIFAPPSG